MIELYDKSNIDHLDWPLTKDAQQVKSYFLSLIRDGSDYYIENVKTTIMLLKMGELILPLTLNHAEYENSYVCSPYTQYIACAQEELHVIDSKALRGVLNAFLSGLGKVLKLGAINRTVIVNNWLLSTNLYPEITPVEVEKITEFLKDKYADHFIVWRSLNESMHEDIINKMKRLDYRQVAGRMVYLLDPQNPATFKKRNIQHDLKILKEDQTRIDIDGRKLSYQEMSTQYEQLYIQKYNKFSPRFMPSYFAMIEKGFINYRELSVNGQSRGYFGYFARKDVMTCPVIGYQPEYNITEQLYRKLTMSITLEAAKMNLFLHKSSGVGDFKRSRGGIPHLEYNMFYGKHLSLFRRFTLGVLYHITTRVGVPMLKKYG